MRLKEIFLNRKFTYFLTLSMLSGSPWLIFSALVRCFLKLLSQYLLLSLTTFPLSAIAVNINSGFWYSTIFCLHEFARYIGEFDFSKFLSVKSFPRELLKSFREIFFDVSFCIISFSGLVASQLPNQPWWVSTSFTLKHFQKLCVEDTEAGTTLNHNSCL